MININNMTESQVRYLLNELLDVSPTTTMVVSMLMLEEGYPQNNEESKMVKKIKVVNKGTDSLENEILCDTTIGNEYLATFIGQGMSTPHGGIAEQDSLSFKDDIGDWVTIWVADETYEVVACHEESVDE